MRFVKYLVVCEYADPEQHDKVPDDLILDDAEQRCFAFDLDTNQFKELDHRGIWHNVNPVT